MNRQTYAWYPSYRKMLREELWIEFLCFSGLFLAALLLFCLNLDGLPLRDWDEALVAQVAKEILQAPSETRRWIFPTLWGEPYLNKPPLVHGLIALVYSQGGVSEWTARLPGALLTTLSVPLLYGLGREVFPARRPALYSALVYLTLLPVVRHGRLAMLDGAILCFQIFMFWAVLRSRRDLRWTLGVGFGFGLICLTKGMMGILLGVIALLFILWDTPRILTSIYLWIGILLGSFPILLWYSAQFQAYGSAFVEQNFLSQSFSRIYSEKDGHKGAPWYYLLEMFKYTWPYLPLFIAGLRLSWENRNWGWAKLILVWTLTYFLVVSVMATKLPWYIIPIYPALALAVGVKLDQLYNLPDFSNYSLIWKILFSSITFIASFACIYFAFFTSDPEQHFLAVIFLCVAITMSTVTALIVRRQRQFISVLFWGMYLSLLLFVSSSMWNWELNEAYPVKPVAEMIVEAQIPETVPIYTSFGYERPSLNFYSNHPIIPAGIPDLRQYWQESSSIYLLVDDQAKKELNFDDAKVIGSVDAWILIKKNPPIVK
ncbi:glycosyltransferase family 39 protein [Gloeocapsa sp. PCC 73106]|uniref:ArnT family glycosyltransferase n=1 Tax=Gloeocapsa sp. PCC 73106 TaxID=102232 RepID=UPI00054D5950|nr:glycosyltransferase family 39 protein [Gloeocapsa sp. PCC 73106]